MKVDETHASVNLMETARETGGRRIGENQADRANKTEQHEWTETEVALSRTSRDVMKVKEAMEAPDPARALRIAELRQQVEDGTYDADARRVADRILESEIAELL
jgi:flagellar biosynthesis anti-sigma factor FlgM